MGDGKPYRLADDPLHPYVRPDREVQVPKANPSQANGRPRMIMKIIRVCRECPHSSYYSGGWNECGAMDNRRFPDKENGKIIQPWCPLDPAPASIT